MTNNKELTSTHFDNQKMGNINNKQQTTVEWLAEQIEILHYDYFTEHISKDEKNQRLKQLKEQAKEMEKELMKGMYVEGSFAKMRYYDGLEYIDADQYYEQIYGGGEQ
jgi:hypothetical protein